jgi:[ribosomal protein S5]-alanine N-acetyltransferase
MNLSLVPFTVHVPYLGDRVALAAHLGLEVHPQWPNPNFAEVLGLFRLWFADDPELAGWVWFVVLDGVVVGEAGAKAAPDAQGVIEIGYGVVPAAQGRGVATAAVGLLVDRVRERGVSKVAAEVLHTNPASQRVLTKLGFECVDHHATEEGPVGWWELSLGPPPVGS